MTTITFPAAFSFTLMLTVFLTKMTHHHEGTLIYFSIVNCLASRERLSEFCKKVCDPHTAHNLQSFLQLTLVLVSTCWFFNTIYNKSGVINHHICIWSIGNSSGVPMPGPSYADLCGSDDCPGVPVVKVIFYQLLHKEKCSSAGRHYLSRRSRCFASLPTLLVLL